jgi:hypothetical protein
MEATVWKLKSAPPWPIETSSGRMIGEVVRASDTYLMIDVQGRPRAPEHEALCPRSTTS